MGAGKSTLCDLSRNALAWGQDKHWDRIVSHPDNGIGHKTTDTTFLHAYELLPGLRVLDFIGVRPQTTAGEKNLDLQHLKYALQGRIKKDRDVKKKFLFNKPTDVLSEKDKDPTTVPDAVIIVVQANMPDYKDTVNQIIELAEKEVSRRGRLGEPPLQIHMCVTHMDRVRCRRRLSPTSKLTLIFPLFFRFRFCHKSLLPLSRNSTL